eukprot:m.37285 g.37285  ORF g.37285 m.37285 type:complete len:383 (-) comp11526_c0_seq1:556-1704(-)
MHQASITLGGYDVERPPDFSWALAAAAVMEWTKRVLQEGQGQPPAFVKGAKALLHFRVGPHAPAQSAATSLPVIVDDSRTLMHEEPFELHIGRQFLLPAWEEAVRSMRKGERAVFSFPPEASKPYIQLSTVLRRQAKEKADSCEDSSCSDTHDHGHGHGHGHSHGHQGGCCAGLAMTQSGQEDLIALTDKALDCEFELIDVLQPGEYERQHWQLSVAEKTERIPLLKAEGNTLFKAGQHAAAADKYGVALGYIEELLSDAATKAGATPEMINVARSERTPCLLNFSACQTALRNFPEAIKHLSEIIRDEPQNAKAWFRRGQTHLLRGRDPDLALSDTREALRLSPNDTAVRTQLAAAEAAVAKAQKEQRDLFAKMAALSSNK